ncbi:MAG: sigma 54-interacting transcriptional regulator [Nitrospirae bacterium]|nr:sigma 54-interacting transcriptional regulator [Nitrospirota bacterium]
MKINANTFHPFILESIAEGIVVIGLDRKIIFTNEMAEKLIGIPKETMEGMPCNKVMKSDLCSKDCPLDSIVNNSNSVFHFNINLYKNNGSSVPLCLNIAPLKDKGGNILGIIENFRPMSVLLDVIKSLEKNNIILTQEKSRIDSIINSLADGVFTTDREMRITSFNEGLERLTGLKQQDILGLFCKEVLKGDNCNSECPLSWTLKNGYGLARYRERIVDNNGNTIPVYICTAFLRDHAGEVTGLVATIKDASEIENLRKELNDRYQFSNIIGRSKTMQEIFELIEIISDTDCAVLIQGESGTGKELIARAIHHNSQRRDKPFIKVNCTAIVEGLFESELFGHVKGAFTGAIKDKTGKFELASGGTIFLDEIGDMPLTSQPKLLRVLQDREFERVGDTETKKVDVRVIAATNRDLRCDIKNKKFREDLFYRLCVVPIEMPSLRERKEDIPLLINHFLEKCSMKFSNRQKITEVSPKAMLAIMEYDWPGNVRELENTIEHAYIRSTTNMIDFESLPPYITNTSVQELSAIEMEKEPRYREDIEKLFIEKRLKRYNGNKARTATSLGLSRTTLWRKLKKYNISVTD